MSGEGFLSRWARLKQERAAEEQAPAQSRSEPDPTESRGAPNAVVPEESPDAAAEGSVEAELTPEELARLPSPEEITRETDLTLFMRKGVPSALRNAALRRMWSLDPAIRDYVDDAREYAWDWNSGAPVPGFGALPEGFDARSLADSIMGAAPAKSTEAEEQAPPARLMSSKVEESTVRDARDECGKTSSHEIDRSINNAAGGPSKAEVSRNSHDSATETEKERAPNVVSTPNKPSKRRHGGAKPV